MGQHNIDILIVEDSDDDYEATLRALDLPSDMERRVMRCRDGAEAWSVLNAAPQITNQALLDRCQFIIMDLNMPGLDGRELLSKIKSDDRLKRIPVAILTTSDDPADVEECYQNGANTYIKKPMNWALFSSQMEALKVFWFEAAALPVRP